MRWIPALIAASLATCLLLPVPSRAMDGSVPVDTELVLAVDVSYSMDEEEQRLQRNGYIEALTSRPFLDALRGGRHARVAIAYMEWAAYNDARVLIPWTLIDGPEAAKEFADRLTAAPYRRASRTSLSGAIAMAVKIFHGNGFAGQRRVIDISGDGPNNNGRPVVQAREEAIAKGFVINGLPLVLKRPMRPQFDIENLDLYYEDCVIGGFGAFSIAVNDTKDFVTATRTKMVLELSSVEPPATAPLLRKASASEPRISCLVGEKQWQERWGGN